MAATFYGAHVTPPEFSGKPEKYINWLADEFMPKLGSRRLAQFAGALSDASGFTVAQLRPYFEAAKKNGLLPRLSAEENNRAGVVEFSVSMDSVSIDGLNCATAADAEILARSRTIATLLPGPTWQGDFDRYAPARLLIDSGAAIALASVFHPSTGSTFNMQMVMAIACTHMALSPEEAISAVTINAAHAIRRAGSIGSLEFGKDADVIMLDVADYREIAYFAGVNPVAMTIRKGNIIYRQGEVQCSEES
ncbi:MAG: amidohydrolase family protein [Bryobacteraceae bacterium]